MEEGRDLDYFKLKGRESTLRYMVNRAELYEEKSESMARKLQSVREVFEQRGES